MCIEGGAVNFNGLDAWRFTLAIVHDTLSAVPNNPAKPPEFNTKIIPDFFQGAPHQFKLTRWWSCRWWRWGISGLDRTAQFHQFIQGVEPEGCAQ